MAAQLGQQPARVLAVEAPVHQVVPAVVAPGARIEVGRGWLLRAPPGLVAVPGRAHVEDVAQQLRLDHRLVGGLVGGAVEAVVADLQHALGLARLLHHAGAAGDVPGHHLFAQHVFAGLQAGGHDVGVGAKRGRHQHRLQVLLLQHLLVVLVLARLAPAVLDQGGGGVAGVAGVDVAEGAQIDPGLRAAPTAGCDPAGPVRSAPPSPVPRAGGRSPRPTGWRAPGCRPPPG